MRFLIVLITFLFVLPGAAAAATTPKIYFSPAQSQQSLSISSWQVSGATWVKKPVITLNGRTYSYDTPQEYMAALKKIQKFFSGNNIKGFDAYLTQSIRQFQAVQGSFPGSPVTGGTTNIPTSTGTGQNSSAVKSMVASADMTGVDTRSEQAVQNLGGPSVSIGNSTYYFGHTSLYPNNKDARLVKFTNGKLEWERADYETGSDQSTGYGLFVTPTGALYAVFSVNGGHNPDKDFNRFTQSGWLKGYGSGDAEVAVIARLDPAKGGILDATYLSSRLATGTTTALRVTDLALKGTSLAVTATTAWSPRTATGQAMYEDKYMNGNASFLYGIVFTPDLRSASDAQVLGGGSW